MVRHSVIASRDDGPMEGSTVRFDNHAWPQYVPLRLPGTRVIEERLPPGAAAVLINPAHTYTDIYLPIDAGEKQLFDAIDGKRNIAQLVAASKAAGWPEDMSAARQFFARLWHHDQVVFDVSQSGDR
jgi:hypothetical protein